MKKRVGRERGLRPILPPMVVLIMSPLIYVVPAQESTPPLWVTLLAVVVGTGALYFVVKELSRGLKILQRMLEN